MTEPEFLDYEPIPPQEGVLQACQITDDNIHELAKLTKATVFATPPDLPGVPTPDGPDNENALVFKDDEVGAGVAIVGDYIVSDMAGRYRAFDKLVFEHLYTR